MLMDEVCLFGMGQERDHTGMDMGGGGGTGVKIDCSSCFCCGLDIFNAVAAVRYDCRWNACVDSALYDAVAIMNTGMAVILKTCERGDRDEGAPAKFTFTR
jgi:hypothetical protein